jgi:septum formation protein
MIQVKRLILASGSPRRKELLKQANLSFDISTSNIPEHIEDQLLPHEVVQQLALQKAKAVAPVNSPDVFLGADTIVAYEGQILGKPTHEGEAKSMLEMLSGKTHEVFTGCAIISRSTEYTFYEETNVTFWELTAEEIDSYVASREGFDKAGGYGIQGLGGVHVKRVEGDYYNVVGLPISRVIRELKKFGIFPSKSVTENN